MNLLRSHETSDEDAATNIINIEDLAKSDGRVIAADGLSLPVEEGSIVGLMGLNTAGKTTTVNMSSNISEAHKMRRLKIYVVLTVAFLTIAIGGWWLLRNALRVSTEGFEIYLLDTDVVALSDEDIVTYTKISHEIELTEEGADKIEKLSLKVPLNGTKFVIKIKGKDIYEGWFWSPISSIPCSGVVIETLVIDNTIKIETGYPSPHFQGEDPRNNPEVFNYFQAVEKFID